MKMQTVQAAFRVFNFKYVCAIRKTKGIKQHLGVATYLAIHRPTVYNGLCRFIYNPVVSVIPFMVITFWKPDFELLAIGIKHKLSGEQAHLISMVAAVFYGLDFYDAVMRSQIVQRFFQIFIFYSTSHLPPPCIDCKYPHIQAWVLFPARL